MITHVTMIWSTRLSTLVCTLRVGFSPSWRVSGSERDILGTSKPLANAGESGDNTAPNWVAEGERIIGDVEGGVEGGVEDDGEGFDDARRPDIRLPAAHSKSSALSPGPAAFHL